MIESPNLGDSGAEHDSDALGHTSRVFASLLLLCVWCSSSYCKHVCMGVCMYVCMYVCTYVRTYVCMYVCMYVCKLCKGMYACVHKYIHIFMYTGIIRHKEKV